MHAAGALVMSVVAVVFFLLIALVFVVVAYRTAIKEKRSFAAFGGALFKLGGVRPGVADAASDADAQATASWPPGSNSGLRANKADVDGASSTARASLAVVRAASELGNAMTDAAAAEREGYLLTALLSATKNHDGAARRASILRVEFDQSNGDQVMVLQTGCPDALFKKPPARFSKRVFDLDRVGLCWAAVHQCEGAHAQDSIKRVVFHAADVSRESSFLATPGHHQFKSILLCPGRPFIKAEVQAHLRSRPSTSRIKK